MSYQTTMNAELLAQYGRGIENAVSSGRVVAAAITAGGTGYTGATVTFSAPDIPGGVQAEGTVALSGDAADTITITEEGSGYSSAPTATIGGDGTGATATAEIGAVTGSASVDAAVITAGGSGYTGATVTFSAPQEAGGVLAEGTVTLDGDAASTITITEAGSGYTAPPTATIGGDGTGALAEATIGALSGQASTLDGLVKAFDTSLQAERLTEAYDGFLRTNAISPAEQNLVTGAIGEL